MNESRASTQRGKSHEHHGTVPQIHGSREPPDRRLFDQDGEVSERIITVYRTSMQGLVFAHCERRNAIRTFAEARILWADYADDGTQLETFAAMRYREEAERWAAVDAMEVAA